MDFRRRLLQVFGAGASLTLTLGLGACTGDDDEPATGDTEADTAVDERVSYYEHVRPLLNEHCVACHTPGSIAPFPLDSYEAVAEAAPIIKAVVEARTMPPFAVKADGSCGDFAEPSYLSDEEVQTISAWVDGGMMAGDATIAAPPAPTLPSLEGGQIGEVGIPQYEPKGSPDDFGLSVDDYQCFKIELDLQQDRYLVGYDVIADNDEIVHHVLGFRIDPNFLGNGATMDALDAADEGPGWDCYGAAGEGVLPQGVPVTWAPGQGAVEFPDGTGVRFAPGDVMVVQMHYNLLDAQGLDATRIKLKWADEVEREGYQVLWDPFLFSSFQGEAQGLTPGMPSVEYSWESTFRQMLSFDGIEFPSIDIYGVIPHMHERGRAMTIDYSRAGQTECGADVDRYDYNWQRTYFYEQPVNVTMDDTLQVTCDFDTSAASSPVMPGFGTQEEMCLVGLFFAPGQ